MDEAFLRRMEIQMFIGNPSPLARETWIYEKGKQCENQSNYPDI